MDAAFPAYISGQSSTVRLAAGAAASQEAQPRGAVPGEPAAAQLLQKRQTGAGTCWDAVAHPPLIPGVLSENRGMQVEWVSREVIAV